MIKNIIIYLALAIVSFSKLCNAKQTINISENVPPQSGVNDKNIPEGLIIDLCKEIFRNIEFKPYPLARALDTTQKEKNTLGAVQHNFRQ